MVTAWCVSFHSYRNWSKCQYILTNSTYKNMYDSISKIKVIIRIKSFYLFNGSSCKEEIVLSLPTFFTIIVN